MNLIKNTYTLWLIFILFLAFFEGGFTFIGIQESLTRAIRDILIILLFISSIFFKSKLNIDLNRSYFGKKINSIPIFSKNYIFLYIFILVSIVSSLFNNKTIVEFFLFFRRVFIPILFFFSVFRISFQIKKVINFLIFCVVIQIPFIIIKFFTLGISESGAIGSISIHSGSLSAIFPLSVISFLAAKYIFDTKIKYIIYSCFFILFGLIGGKRVLIAFLPILLLIIPFFYNYYVSKTNTIFYLFRNLFFALILGFISFYFIVRLSPSLNFENKIWGSFSIEYVNRISSEYNSATYEKGFSRFDAPLVVYDLLNSKNIINLFLGFGPGDIIQSSINNYAGITNDRQLLMYKYGVGYGARSGFLWMMIQTGILGSLCFLLFLYTLFKRLSIILKYTNNTNLKFYSLSLMGFLFVILLDYIIYSSVFFNIGAISNTFYLLYALVIMIYEKEYIFISNESTSHNK